MSAQNPTPATISEAEVYPVPRVNRGDRGWILRWVLVGLALVVGMGLTVVVVNIVQDGGLSALRDVPSLGIPSVLTIVLILAIYGILGLGPGADRISFGPDGFEFTYRTGKKRVFRWTRGRGRLTLWVLTDSDGTGFWISTGIPFQTPISPVVYGRILKEAERNGFIALERSQSVGTGARQTVVQLIRNT